MRDHDDMHVRTLEHPGAVPALQFTGTVTDEHGTSAIATAGDYALYAAQAMNAATAEDTEFIADGATVTAYVHGMAHCSATFAPDEDRPYPYPEQYEPPGPRYIAHFAPEAWQHDNAVEVDAEGPQTWDCTRFAVNRPAYMAQMAERRGNGDDFLLDTDDVFRGDPAAPAWVRDWHGPFTIRIRLAS